MKILVGLFRKLLSSFVLTNAEQLSFKRATQTSCELKEGMDFLLLQVS